MEIDAQVTKKIANLARIAIKEEEVDDLSKDLSKILTFMDQLNQLNTDHVEPLIYMNESTNVWREDVIDGVLSTEDGLKNAPTKEGNFFTVPKIIEK